MSEADDSLLHPDQSQTSSRVDDIAATTLEMASLDERASEEEEEEVNDNSGSHDSRLCKRLTYVVFFGLLIFDWYTDIRMIKFPAKRLMNGAEILALVSVIVGGIFSWSLVLLYFTVIKTGRQSLKLGLVCLHLGVLHAVFESFPQFFISIYKLMAEKESNYLCFLSILASFLVACMTLGNYFTYPSARQKTTFVMLYRCFEVTLSTATYVSFADCCIRGTFFLENNNNNSLPQESGVVMVVPTEPYFRNTTSDKFILWLLGITAVVGFIEILIPIVYLMKFFRPRDYGRGLPGHNTLFLVMCNVGALSVAVFDFFAGVNLWFHSALLATALLNVIFKTKSLVSVGLISVVSVVMVLLGGALLYVYALIIAESLVIGSIFLIVSGVALIITFKRCIIDRMKRFVQLRN